MVCLPVSGTTRRLIGVLVLIPIITAVWIDIKIASIMVTILGAGMTYEFSKMLKTPAIIAIAITFLIAVQ